MAPSGKKRKRGLPPHFSITTNGDVLVTDRLNRRILRFSRTQVELFLDFDQQLRAGRFAAGRDAVPGGYIAFAHLWNSASQEPVPSSVLLPQRRAAAVTGEADPEYIQGMMRLITKKAVQESDSREFHIQKRGEKRARRSETADHFASTSGRVSRMGGRADSTFSDTATEATFEDSESLFDFTGGFFAGQPGDFNAAAPLHAESSRTGPSGSQHPAAATEGFTSTTAIPTGTVVQPATQASLAMAPSPAVPPVLPVASTNPSGVATTAQTSNSAPTGQQAVIPGMEGASNITGGSVAGQSRADGTRSAPVAGVSVSGSSRLEDADVQMSPPPHLIDFE